MEANTEKNNQDVSQEVELTKESPDDTITSPEADTSINEEPSENTTETVDDIGDTDSTDNNNIDDTDSTKKDNKELHTEDNLEIAQLGFFGRIKAKHQRFLDNAQGMTKAEKLKYFLYYYKERILISMVVIFLAIAIPVTIYNKSRPVAIAYAVVNCDSPKFIKTELFEDYKDFYNFADSTQILDDKDVHLDAAEYNENTVHSTAATDYSQFPILCHNNYYDIIFTDLTGMEFLAHESVVLTLQKGLSTDMYNLINEEYSHLILEVPNYNGDLTPYAIDITDTEFAKELNLGYSPVYVCFPGNSERNIINSKKMLNYILDLGLDL
ncbi:MAG: hypothetical protein IJX12_06440 [Lachnospiraceae bacterium]|nr:hypothetical protein [Lachnospiraceae bacterium]